MLSLQNTADRLEVKTGELILLTGGVGFGKSYFLKQLAGLYALPSSITATIPQADMMFDTQPPLWMGQYVSEELNHGLKIQCTDSRMQQILQTWRLHDITPQTPLSQLNRLQSLRLRLATMSLSGQLLWLLDNPTACLPVSDSQELRLDMISWIKKHGCMVIVACNRWEDWQGQYSQHWHIQKQGSWPYLEQQ
ncbi:MAG: ATP-binding cassette domain-containing protein [Mariprofundaceae bacterium]|nr:ATP-binding cassette domain-containing protein [Mariprofundaceae bacterium]